MTTEFHSVNEMNMSTMRALVTGATSGIGNATARAFAAEGAYVLGVGRRREALDALEAAAEPLRGEIETVSGDVTDEVFVEAMIRQAGDVDILVNCAGLAKHAPFLDGRYEDWRAVFEVNVLSVMRVTQAVARGMRVRGRGHIFNISSILADRVYPYTMAYAATKHAIRGVCRGLRVELAPHGIKVTDIAPGLVDTNILDNVEHPTVLEAYASRPYPPLRPEDVARQIVAAAASSPNTCPELITINPIGQV